MYDDEQVKEKGGGVKALATFIVDKRNLFFLLYIFAFVFCFFKRLFRDTVNFSKRLRHTSVNYT